MRTTVETERLQIHPGKTGTLDVDVVNTSDVIDGLSATIDGLDPAFVRITPPVVTLFPDSVGRLTVTLDLPKTYPAGDSFLNVRVSSTVDARLQTENPVWLTVDPVESADISLRPSLVVAGSEARFGVIVTNTGNVTTEFEFNALEPTRAIECRVIPPTTMVPPGESRAVYVFARGKRPWFSQVIARTIKIEAKSPTVTLEDTARFNQKPRIPRGVLTALILAAIIALWALIFLFVISYLRNSGAPTKTVPASWNTHGVQEVPLASVVGTISGKVTASTTQAGLARITVEAYRVKTAKDGTHSTTLSASGATGDDGTYSLGALLPGQYQFRFSADGYDPVWYTLPADLTKPAIVRVDPLATLEGVNGVLTGHAGTLSGKVGAPPGVTNAAPPTVTVTLVPADPAAAAPAGIPATVNPDGTFSAPGLATPATYSVSVARPGFDTQTFPVTLAGGESPVIDTAKLAASAGSIAGTVVDSNKAPLGNVTVTVNGGAVKQVSTTPTTGNIGHFEIDNLPAPGTYVLTFTHEGFSSQTIALDLTGGENKTGLIAQLVGGAGTVGGMVTDSTGTPLGGVAITASNGSISAATTTLTTGTGSGGLGSYTLANLPVPGTYSITFSLPGYSTETISVNFDGAGRKPGDATLRPITSNVSGTVSLAGNGQAGVTLTLSDGTVPATNGTATTGTLRTTQTAATPAGAFLFDSVAPGYYTVTASGPNINTAVTLILVTAGQASVTNIAVTAP